MGNSWLLEVAIPGYDTLPWTLFKIGLDLQAMDDFGFTVSSTFFIQINTFGSHLTWPREKLECPV